MSNSTSSATRLAQLRQLFGPPPLLTLAKNLLKIRRNCK
jgi:hypothetical protein